MNTNKTKISLIMILIISYVLSMKVSARGYGETTEVDGFILRFDDVRYTATLVGIDEKYNTTDSIIIPNKVVTDDQEYNVIEIENYAFGHCQQKFKKI